jgi:hypothetical protein
LPCRRGSPAGAVLAALTADPGGATVAVIAGHAGITVAAARQALTAHEKTGTATRVKGGRPGVPDTWKPATGPAAPPGTDSAAGGGQPPAGGVAHDGQPAPASAAGTAAGGET